MKKYMVMTMFDEIQKIIAPRTLSSFEYMRLEELSKIYSEEEILNIYKNYGYKPMSYITKTLEDSTNKKSKAPEWLNREIINQPIDEETEKIFNDFQEFLNDFRGEKNDREIN